MNNKGNDNSKGSISVLLIIIMVPMVFLAGIIVDFARRQYASEMAANAGDLALNAAIATYDQTLADNYGLFALTQSDNNINTEVWNYFKETLIPNSSIPTDNGLNGIKGLTDGLTGNWGSAISLDCEWVGGDGLSGISETALSNAPILKTQIVEFMKYRTPVYGGLSIIDALASFKKMSSQAAVTEAQLDVNDKIEDMNDSTKKAYDAVSRVVNFYRTNEADITGVRWNGNLYEDDYQVINNFIGQVYDGYETPVSGVVEGDETPKWVVADGNVLPEVSSPSLEETITKMGEAARENADIYAQLDQRYTDISTIQAPYYRQRKIYIEERYNNSIPAAWKLYAYRKLYQLQYDERVRKELERQQSCALLGQKYTPESIPEYTAFAGDYSYGMTAAYEATQRAHSYYNELEAARADVEQRALQVREHYVKYTVIYSRLSQDLSEASLALQEVLDNLENVNTANSNFKAAITTYNGADEADSFAQQMQNEADYNDSAFDKESVQNLKDAIDAAKIAADNVVAAMNSVQYNGGHVSLYYTFDDLRYAYNNMQYGPEALLSNTFTMVKFPGTGVPAPVDDNAPFWRYLKAVYGTAEKNETEEEAQNNKKNEFINKASDVKNQLNANGGVDVSGLSIDSSSLPSSGSSSYASASNEPDVSQLNSSGNERESRKNFIKDIGNLFNEYFSVSKIEAALRNARDNIYLTDYVTRMFTYNTIDKVYSSKNGNEDDKHSLTGVVFNSDNNKLYGAEVEYVLFGSSSAEENVETAKNIILVIRILANSGYALTSGTVDTMTKPIAMAIQTATLGVVPYKIPEVIMELGLAVAESYIDLYKLMEGEKVPLLKTDSSWVLSPTGFVKELKDLAKETAKEVINAGMEYAVSSVTDMVDKAGSYVTVNTTELVNNTKDTINGKVEEALSSFAGIVTDAVNGEIKNLKEQAVNSLKSADELAQEVISNTIAKGKSYIETTYADKNETVKAILEKALEVIEGILRSEYQSALSQAFQSINNIEDGAITGINNISAGIQDRINGIVRNKTDGIANTINEKVVSMVSEFEGKINECIRENGEALADDLIDATNGFIDRTFESIPTNLQMGSATVRSSTGLSSFLEFSYLDYLRILLFVKFSVEDSDGGDMVLRVGDLIQMNVAVQSGNDNYSLSKAYTYVKFRANVNCRPTFITMENFKNIIGDSGITNFAIRYESILGY